MAGGLDMTNPVDIWLSFTFHYRPDLTGNAIFIVLFSILTIIVVVLNYVFYKRTRNPAVYMHAITVVGLMQVIGYALRIDSSKRMDLTGFIVTTVCLLMAPILLAAVNYVVVGKLLKATNRPILFIQPRHATSLFLWADILCFMIQASAAALLTSKDPTGKTQDKGTAIVLFGLALQTFFFTAFLFISMYMAFSEKFAMMANPQLRPVFVGLFLTIACLTVRNVFRFVEFASGRDSELNAYELIFFCFETVPILASFIAYCFYHFGRLLPVDDELPALVNNKGTEKEKKVESSMNGVEMQQV